MGQWIPDCRIGLEGKEVSEMKTDKPAIGGEGE